MDPAAAAEELGYSRRVGNRLLFIARSDETLLAVFREKAVSVFAAESLARIAVRDVKKAVRLAERFASGGITASALEEAAGMAPHGKAVATVGAKIDFKVTAKNFNLDIHVPRKELDDVVVRQICTALETFMGHLGVSELHAAAVQRQELAANGDSRGSAEAA